MLNRWRLNTTRPNVGIIPSSAAAPPDIAPSLGVPFRFEVHSRAGAWLANVQYWRAGERSIAANEPDQLTLEIASDDDCAAELAFPNEIWMWRGEYTTVWQKFKILATRQRRDDIGNWITVECESLLGDLGRELVTLYQTPVEDDPDDPKLKVYTKETVGTILSAVLAFQTQTPAIRLGPVDFAIRNIEVAIRLENKSILQCLAELRKITGGYFYVDTDRVLRWKRTVGYELGHWLRLDHNMGEIEVYTDYRAIKTRVIGRGAGFNNDTRLLSQQDDTTAQSDYGVIVGTFVEARINEQDTLDALAEQELARQARPAISYRMGVIDLAQIDPDRYSFEALMLTPGTAVNVICDDPAIDIVSRVRRVKWDLADPAHVEVEFSDPESGVDGDDGTHEEDLADRVVDLIQRAEEALSDTGIAQAIGRSMDPATDDVGRILTEDNFWDRGAAVLGDDYGVGTDIGNAADDFSDAMLQRLIDALGDSAHPMYGALRTALGSLGENNVWLPYTGS